MIDAYGSDIGNAYAFLSVVTQEELDALPMLPVQIDRLGMPTIAYVTPPEGSPIYVNFAANCDFRTRSRIKHDPGHIVRAIKTQLHGNKPVSYTHLPAHRREYRRTGSRRRCGCGASGRWQ